MTKPLCRSLSSSGAAPGDTFTLNGVTTDARSFRCTKPERHTGDHAVTFVGAGAFGTPGSSHAYFIWKRKRR
jgi:hypothetical protein